MVGAKWDRWKKSFQIYLAALGNVQEARKKALLLHCGGQELQEIFKTFEEQFVAVDDVRPTVANCTYRQAGEALGNHFAARRNDSFEHNVFQQMGQADGESTANRRRSMSPAYISKQNTATLVRRHRRIFAITSSKSAMTGA